MFPLQQTRMTQNRPNMQPEYIVAVRLALIEGDVIRMDLTRHLNNLYLLVRVIDAGNMSAAARELGTSRSLLSRHIIALEKALGTQLLHRDARRFAVTPSGEAVYREAVLMCDAAHAAVASAQEAVGAGQGPLRVGMCDALSSLMAAQLTAFADHYPQIQLSMHDHNDIDALLCQEVDVVMHLRHALPNSADIVARPLGQSRLVAVASPALLQKLGHPQHPEDIAPHYCLAYTGHGLPPQWQLNDGADKRQSARLFSNRIDLMLEAARSGIGFAQLPLFVCREDLATGRLQQVFEAFEADPLPLRALTVTGHARNDTVLDFIQFARQRIADGQMPGVEPTPQTDTQASVPADAGSAAAG